MNTPTLAVVIIVMTLNGVAAYGQLEKLRFEHITVREGLSDDNAICIFKDPKGYMWFGTWNGLNKYDGYTITNFFADPNDEESLSYNTIFSIHGGNNGKLYFTIAGANVTTYNVYSEKFRRFIPPMRKRNAIHLGITRAIMQDTGEVLWIGNNNGELARFSVRDSIFLPWSFADSVYLMNHFLRVGLAGVDKFYKDRRGALWIGSYNGFYKYSPASKIGDSSFTGYMMDKRVTAIYESRKGVFWIGTSNGLHRWDQKENQFTAYTHDDNDPTSISGNFITGIAEDKTGNLWISTRNGLNTLDPEIKKPAFIRYYHDPGEPTSLSNNFIFSQYMDSSNVLWCATLGGGVSKLDLNQTQISVYRSKKADEKSLSDNKVTALLEDDEGKIWIGTAHGGVNVWNRHTNRYTHYLFDSLKPKSIAGNMVAAILKDRDGDIWIGTGENNATAALSRFEPATSTFKNYYFNYRFAGPPSGNVMMSLYQSRDGIIWLGTSHGYFQFDKTTGKSIHVPYDGKNENGISDYWVNCFYEDKKGNMWMGPNSNALNKLDVENGKVKHYYHIESDTTSIASTIVKTMFKDSYGRPWFGTRSGGLALLNEDNATFTNFTTRDGLPSNTVFSITEDDDNNLWLLTNKGIAKLNCSSKKVTTYTTADGLPGNHFESEVGSSVPSLKSSDGLLFFGGPYGLIVIDPKKMDAAKPIGDVVVTQFKIFDQPVKGVLKDTIVLNYDQNFVSFEFASLTYANPSQNKYAYMLAGVDRNWVASGSRRLATYTNLAPGEYQFVVRASSDNENWKEIKTPIVLIINPPWWQTWWFYLAIVLAAIGGVYALFKYRLHQKVEIYRIRNRIHRDLHDDVGATLSSVKAYSEILKDNPDKPMIADLIIENANDMIISLEDISWATNPQFDNMGSLVSKIRKFAVPLLRSKKIELDVQLKDIEDSFQLPGEVRRNLLLTVKEALNNVYKYSMATKCTIQFSLAHRVLNVVVSDNGVGMNGVVQGAGNGLKNMKKRVTELHGRIDVDSEADNGTSISISIRYPFVFTSIADIKSDS